MPYCTRIGLIQTHLVPQRLDARLILGQRGLRPETQHRRITGRQAHQREDDDRDDEQRRHGLQAPPQDEAAAFRQPTETPRTITCPIGLICQPEMLGLVSDAAGTSCVTMTGMSATKMSCSFAYSSLRLSWSSVVAA